MIAIAEACSLGNVIFCPFVAPKNESGRVIENGVPGAVSLASRTFLLDAIVGALVIQLAHSVYSRIRVSTYTMTDHVSSLLVIQVARIMLP